MRRLDRLHLKFPFAGSRMLRGLLAAEGCKVGRRHVKTLMQRMGDRGALSPSAHDQFAVPRSGCVLLYAAEDALHIVRQRLEGTLRPASRGRGLHCARRPDH